MVWKPVDFQELANSIASEIERLGIQDASLIRSSLSQMRRIPSSTGSAAGHEIVLIHGIGLLLLVYDDIEDEFGIAERSRDGAVNLRTFPEFAAALREYLALSKRIDCQ